MHYQSSYQTRGRPGDKRVVMASSRLRLRRSATPSCWGVLRIECSRRMPASVRKQSNSPDEYSPPISPRGIWILRPVTFSAHTLYRFKPKNVGLTTDKVDCSKWGEFLHDRYPIATASTTPIGQRAVYIRVHTEERNFGRGTWVTWGARVSLPPFQSQMRRQLERAWPYT